MIYDLCFPLQLVQYFCISHTILCCYLWLSRRKTSNIVFGILLLFAISLHLATAQNFILIFPKWTAYLFNLFVLFVLFCFVLCEVGCIVVVMCCQRLSVAYYNHGLATIVSIGFCCRFLFLKKGSGINLFFSFSVVKIRLLVHMEEIIVIKVLINYYFFLYFYLLQLLFRLPMPLTVDHHIKNKLLLALNYKDK